MITNRLRPQLEGAIQATVAGVVVVMAFVASHIQPWNVPGFRPARTYALLQLGGLALAYALVIGARPRRLPGAGAVAALAVVALASAAWSPAPSLTLERAGGFALVVGVAALLAFVTLGRPRFAAQVLLALLAATTLVALAGVVELWHASDQAIVPATKGQGARYNGIGQNPNQVAMLIALTSPLALWSIREARRRARAGAVAAAVLLGLSLVASGSRGALLAAFVGCLVYVLATRSGRRLAAAAVVAGVFAAAGAATQLPRPAQEDPVLYEEFGRTPTLSPHDVNSELPLESELGFPGENVEPGDTRTLLFTSGRGEAWVLAVRQGLRRPIAGYGFGTEDRVFVDRSYLFVADVVENSYIGVFLQLGAVGLVLLVFALVLPLAAWLRARPALDHETAMHAAAAAGVVAAGAALALPQSYLTSAGSPPTAPLWIALFLLAALVSSGTARRRSSTPADRHG